MDHIVYLDAKAKELENFETLIPFKFDRSEFGNMDDWLPVETIENVK